MEMQVLDEKLASEGKRFELSKKEVLNIPEASSSCDLDSIKWEQIQDHSECRKEIQLDLMLIKNRQLKRLVKICGDSLRGYQFQC